MFLAMQEVEVKIRLKTPATAATVVRRLRAAGFRRERRDWQRDIVLDQEHLELRAASRLLRLRRHSSGWLLTFKGPPERDQRYKAREEIETTVTNGRNLELILERLGFHIAFSYEKRRRTLPWTIRRSAIFWNWKARADGSIAPPRSSVSRTRTTLRNPMDSSTASFARRAA
jgi:hypothetical protein